VTFAVTDGNGNPVTSGVTVSSTTNAGNGTYTAQLSGTLAGTYTVTPQNGGSPVGGLSDTVTLTAGTTPDAGPGNSTFTPPSPQSITADGIATSTLSFTAKDANGNLITDLTAVTFAVTDGNGNPVTSGISVSGTTNAGNGTYTAQLSGTLAGTYTVTPQNGGSPVGNLSDTVTLTAGTTPDTGAGNSTLTVSPPSITAGNTETSTLTFTAKDAHGNLIAGLTSLVVTVTGSDGNPVEGEAVTVSDVTETGSPGVYTATLGGTLADTYTAALTLNGAPLSGLSATVAVTAGTTPDDGQTLFYADVGAIIPDGDDTATLTLEAKDVFGNAITGLAAQGLTFELSPTSASMTLSAVTDAGNGKYTATLKGTQAGDYTVTPKINGTQVGTKSELIHVAAVATDVQDILVNGYTFAKDAGFPKTGFIGAKFTVQLNGGEPTDVIWSSSSNWAHVDDSGNVSFNAIGDSSMVTITATSKADTSRAFTYQFTVENWFKSAGSFASGTAAEAGCAEIGGRLPTSLEQSGLEYTQNNSVQVDRGVGNLYGEWGPELPGSGLTKGIAAQGPSYVKTDPQPQQVCGRKYTRTPGMSLTGSAGYVQISNVGYDNGSGRFSSCQPNRYYQVEAFCRVSGN
ncbi:TPA: invasin domain 3-containing protein, partial [Serratia marcescens]